MSAHPEQVAVLASFDGNLRGLTFGWGAHIKDFHMDVKAAGNLPAKGGSNEAEVEAAIHALEIAHAVAPGRPVELSGDSKAVIDAINGGDQLKGISPERAARLRDAMSKFPAVTAVWVPRTGNREADRLAASHGLPTFAEAVGKLYNQNRRHV
jgi:ribonuclease HI